MDKRKRDMTEEEHKMLERYLYEICKEVYLLSKTYEVDLEITMAVGSDHAKGTYRDNMAYMDSQTITFTEGEGQ